MKHSNTFTLLMFAGLGSAAIAGTALASSGYALDSAGKAVTSDFGECIQTGAWSPDLSTPECDPAMAARLKAERLEAERLAAEKARRSAELAAMERPAPDVALVRLSDKRNVMFEFNSAVLTPAATEELDRVISKIREFDEVDGVEIVGHTDSSGPENYNRTLSEKRAASVKQFLKSRGVGASLLSARGEGEANPLADNRTRDGRVRNRRVDILVSGNAAE